MIDIRHYSFRIIRDYYETDKEPFITFLFSVSLSLVHKIQLVLNVYEWVAFQMKFKPDCDLHMFFSNSLRKWKVKGKKKCKMCKMSNQVHWTMNSLCQLNGISFSIWKYEFRTKEKYKFKPDNSMRKFLHNFNIFSQYSFQLSTNRKVDWWCEQACSIMFEVWNKQTIPIHFNCAIKHIANIFSVCKQDKKFLFITWRNDGIWSISEFSPVLLVATDDTGKRMEKSNKWH